MTCFFSLFRTFGVKKVAFPLDSNPKVQKCSKKSQNEKHASRSTKFDWKVGGVASTGRSGRAERRDREGQQQQEEEQEEEQKQRS